jgi:TRAP-type C4-dicarboxylate transport system substrate-binding protein
MIVLDLQAGGAVVSGETALSSVENGLVDGAAIAASYTPHDLPINGGLIPSLAFLHGDSRVLSAAVADLVLLNCSECLEEVKNHNMVVFGPFATARYDLACRNEVKTAADLRGLRVRVPGEAWSHMAVAMGMTPASMSGNELYEALQRGTVDCNFTTVDLLQTMSLGEVSPHITQMPAGNLFSPLLMTLNLDLWRGFDPETQDAFIAASPAAVAGQAYSFRDAAQAVLENAAELGYSVTMPAAETSAALDEVIQRTFDETIAQAEENGISNAQQIAATLVSLVEKWDAILAETEDTEEAFAAVLGEEIYSQFPRDVFH